MGSCLRSWGGTYAHLDAAVFPSVRQQKLLFTDPDLQSADGDPFEIGPLEAQAGEKWLPYLDARPLGSPFHKTLAPPRESPRFTFSFRCTTPPYIKNQTTLSRLPEHDSEPVSVRRQLGIVICLLTIPKVASFVSGHYLRAISVNSSRAIYNNDCPRKSPVQTWEHDFSIGSAASLFFNE
ncbi:hypothetical protein WAI453_009135 [Rhynchosporium graminicola]